LIADTFEYTDADGSYMTRPKWLHHIEKEVDDYEQLGNTSMAVYQYGNSAAVVTGQYRDKIRLQGKSLVRSGRFTDMWIKQGTEWHCAASQVTLIGH
jgi:Domain of unknown function (DUF4440)